MLAALAASGQTPSAFARAKGFGPYRVSYWRAKLDERRGSKAGARHDGFVAVEVRDDKQAPSDATGPRGIMSPGGEDRTYYDLPCAAIATDSYIAGPQRN